MKNIDFLPPRYRQRHQAQRAFVWEIAVVALFGLLIVAAAAWQFQQRWHVGAQLAAQNDRHRQSVETQATYEQLQAKLASGSEAAELCVYLEHPWPRTQVLQAIEKCLSDDMSLTDVHVTYEATSGAPPVDEAEQAKLSPTKRDLAQLRRETDRRVTLVWIAGATNDAGHVYEFADRLGKSSPFAAVKLETAENQATRSARQTGFRLRGTLKPGYGQPAGPQGTQVAEHQP